MSELSADVVVIGGGNAALCAALAARDEGADVLLLERAPEAERGGNSYYTGGIIRFPYEDTADLIASFPELEGGESGIIDADPYTEAHFFEDMAKTTDYRSDPDLLEALVRESRGTMEWMHGKGIRLLWSLGRHAHKVEGRFRFFGGAIVTYWGGGAGLIDTLYTAAETEGIRIRYGTRAVELLGKESGRVTGVRVRVDGEEKLVDIAAKSVVIASGGFQANTAMRTQYLGPGWDLARVRGTAFNTGDGIQMATDFGAKPFGHWSGCHAVAWDANAPLTGDRSMGDEFSRHSYPMGIVINKESKRFLDEGYDFHTHTYARYGQEILKQPGMIAYQLFDDKVEQYLRSDYRGRHVTRVKADTIEELAEKLDLDPAALRATIDEYNASIDESVPFDPNVKDGRATSGITPRKSNWAQRIDTAPFLGFAVTTGITFTFGGLRVDANGKVLDDSERHIPGLYAGGELVGGIFYHNYPTGTGLMTGSVFGRAAGRSAAHAAAAGA